MNQGGGFCTSCGDALAADDRFCSTCGHAREMADQTTCANCGAANPSNNEYCETCGYPLRAPVDGASAGAAPGPNGPPPVRERPATAAADQAISPEPKKRRRWGALVGLLVVLIAAAAVAQGNFTTPTTVVAENDRGGGTFPLVTIGPEPTLGTLPETTQAPADDSPLCDPICPPVPSEEWLAEGRGAFRSLVDSNDQFWAANFGQLSNGAEWWPVDISRIHFVCPDDGSIDPYLADTIVCPANPRPIVTDRITQVSKAPHLLTSEMIANGLAPEPGETLGYDLIALDTGAIIAGWEEFYNGTMIFVLAHEYAHQVQWRLGLFSQVQYGSSFEATVAYELQADCFAGAQTGAMSMGGSLTEWILDQGTRLFDLYGGGDHGTGEQRAEAFRQGWQQGAASCLSYTPFYDVDRAFPSNTVQVLGRQSSADLTALAVTVLGDGNSPITAICVYVHHAEGGGVVGPNGLVFGCVEATAGATAVVLIPYELFPVTGGQPSYLLEVRSFSDGDQVASADPDHVFQLNR